MRTSFFRTTAVAAAAALTLAACGEDNDDQALPEDDPAAEDLEDLEDDALDDMLGDQEDMEDPNEDVEDEVYRGIGIVLPVPEGWRIDPQAFQQGAIVAMTEDQSQQVVGMAANDEEHWQTLTQLPADIDGILETIRPELGDELTVDEEVEIEGAERAHRLTLEDMPPPEGQPGAEEMGNSSQTVIFAEGDGGAMAQFAVAAATDDYDAEIADLLVAVAGFDPDSEPPEPMMQQPPEGEMSPEDMEELEDMMEDQG